MSGVKKPKKVLAKRKTISVGSFVMQRNKDIDSIKATRKESSKRLSNRILSVPKKLKEPIAELIIPNKSPAKVLQFDEHFDRLVEIPLESAIMPALDLGAKPTVKEELEKPSIIERSLQKFFALKYFTILESKISQVLQFLNTKKSQIENQYTKALHLLSVSSDLIINLVSNTIKVFENIRNTLSSFVLKQNREITLFTKSRFAIAFNSLHLIQGVVVSILLLVCLLFIVGLFIPKPQPQISQSQIINSTETITTQTSRIIAGKPVKWTAIVKANSITTDQKYIKLPQGAENIKVKAITKAEAKQIVNQQITEQDLTTKERQALAGQSGNKLMTGIRKFSNILLANLEETATQVVEQITEAIPLLSQEESVVIETPSETVVDVSEVVETVETVEDVEDVETVEAVETVETVEAETITEELVVSPEELEGTSPELVEGNPEVPTETPVEIPVETPVETPTDNPPVETLPVEEPPSEYVKVEYETLAPEITEQETKKGKIVTISSTEEKACEQYKPHSPAGSGQAEEKEKKSEQNPIVSFYNSITNQLSNPKSFFANLEDSISQVVESVIPEVVEPAQSPVEVPTETETPPAETPTEVPTETPTEVLPETPVDNPPAEEPAQSPSDNEAGDPPVETPSVETPIAESPADDTTSYNLPATSSEQQYQDCLDSQPELTNVLAYTTIPEIYQVGQEDRIKVRWKNNNNQSVAFTAHDTNSNGMLDYVEWTVPHLSEQIFEIIFINKALHLDKNLKVIDDIYNQVRTQDDTWSTIPKDNYVRVTFEKILDNTRDITVYARPNCVLSEGTESCQVNIEVYPVYTDANGNLSQGSKFTLVADNTNPDFSNIDHNGKYRVLLTNLSTPTDVFDLKVVSSLQGGQTNQANPAIDFDYILDPSVTKYARTAGGNWSDDATWSTTSGGTADTVAPTAEDNVIFDSNSGNVTIDAGASRYCRSLNMTSGTGNYAGTLTHANATALYIGDSTAGAGNVALKFSPEMTYTLLGFTSSTLNFVSTSATVQDIDFAGINTPSVTFNATSNGSWKLTGTWGTSAVNASQTVTLTKGTLDTNGQTCYWGALLSNVGANTRTLTLGSSTINLYATSGALLITYIPTFTLTANTATLSFNATTYSAGTILINVMNGVTNSFNTFIINGASRPWISMGGNSVVNLYRTGTAVKTDELIFYTDIVITGELKLQGNSSTNRLIVQSDTLGTARTLTVTGATLTNNQNVDFRDITFANGGSNVDLSTITGGSGDAGGNSISGGGTLSFTTADDWYWYNAGAGTYNFSDYSHWYTATNGGGSQMASTRVVLPQDNAFFDADSVTGATTVDQDMPRVCKSLDFTGVDPVNFHINNISQTIYGGLIGSSNVVVTDGDTASFTFEGRSSYNLNAMGFLSGSSILSININMIGGTLTLTGDLLTSRFNRNLSLNNGTFDANGYNVTCGHFYSNGSSTRALLMGSGTWTLGTGYSGGWIVVSTNLTFDAETSTIVSPGDGYDVNTFAGGGLTYNNVTFGTSAYNTTITGSNTFNNLTINGPKTVNFTAGTTQTINGTFSATGTAGNVITMQSTSAGSAFTLSKSSGTVSADYISLQDSTATGGAIWLPGLNSTNVSGNTGWSWPKYWVGGTGNWSDDDNHWATTSGGSPANGNIPSTGDIVYFDSSSGTGTVTIDTGSVSVLDLNETSSNITIATSTNGITVTGDATVNGTISGATAITLNTASKTLTAGSGATISSPVVLGATRTVAVASGTLTMSGIISDGGSAYGISKTGAGQLTLSGANTFTGGLTIKAGIASSGNSGPENAFGSGAISVGDTSGTADATLQVSGWITFANQINVVSGSSGTLKIYGYLYGPVLSGAITLNNNLTISNATNNGPLYVTGGITGTGNVILTSTDAVGIIFSTNSINHTGTITNSGSGTGGAVISAIIGTNVTGVIQNSATSQLTLSGANTFTGGLTIKAGIVTNGASNNSFGADSSVITLGDTSGSADASISTSGVNWDASFANPITVASGSSGTLSIIANNNNTLSGAITLNNNLTIKETTIYNLNVTGGITGTGNVVTQNTNSGTITISGSSINSTGTITNSGTGTGTTTISAVIGTNVTGVIQNSATSQLTLSGVNTFTGGLTIKAGTVYGISNANAFGANSSIITIGDTSGTANATLLAPVSGAFTFANPITVASGSSGTLSIINGNNNTFSGAITLNNNLTITNDYYVTFTGGVTGTGNLISNYIGSGGWTTFSGTSIDMIGSITSLGAGTGSTIISSVIGTNVTGVIQNSATSQLTLSGANTFTGGLTIKAGTVLGTTSSNAFGANSSVITIGDTSGSANASLGGWNGLTFANPITVASGSSGNLSIISYNNIFTGAITLANNLTLYSIDNGTRSLDLTGGITGTGNLIISNSGSGLFTLSGTSVNNTGTITNSGSGTGTTTISAVIGTNVTGVIQNSSTSALKLSGNNSTVGDIDIQAGTLNLDDNTNLNVSDDWSNAGTFTADPGSTVTFTTGNHTITGANTFNNLTLSASNTVTLPASTTQTISGTMTCTGTAGNIITINSSSTPTQATFSKASGTVDCDYIALTDNIATGGATFTATNSTGSNYTGWLGLNTAPNAPTLVSPANDTDTTDTTPTLSANYSDPDTGDVGTTNYRISSSSLVDCTTNTNVIKFGTSSETADNNEDTTFTPTAITEGDATYYWCAQNDDSVLQSAWTQMGTFNLDTTPPTTMATAGSYTFGETSPDPVTVTLTCDDAGGSGCLSTVYCTDTANTCSPATPYVVPFEISAEGTTYVRFYSIDALSNTETPTNSETVIIDLVATRYWVGGTGNWSDDDNHWATTSGGSPGNGNIPATGDIVYFDTSSGSGTVTIDTSSVSVLDLIESSTGIIIATSTNGITVTGDAVVNGTISGATAVTLNTASKTLTAGSGATISSPVVLGATRTVDVASGTLTMSGIISDGGNAYSISKTGAGQLTLSGANTFTGGLIIKAGIVLGATSSNCFGGSGTGAVTIGDTSGTADAMLRSNIGGTIANPITIASGSSGVLSVDVYSATAFTGAITLNNNFTISAPYGSPTFSGGITGTGNVILNSVARTYNITISTTSINHTGTITNSGTGTGTTTISAVIGSNVTGVIQNSASSQLTLSGVNTFTSGLTIKAGIVNGYTSANAFGANSNVITIGDTSGSADATLIPNNMSPANPITVASGSSGTLSIKNGNSGPTLSGAITLNNNLIISNTATADSIALTGGITGTGNIILNATTSMVLGLSGASINHTGTITNSGSGTGTVTISAVIGTNVTGVIQNSATSQLSLSGINAYLSGTTIKAGTLLGSGSNFVFGYSGGAYGPITLGDSSGTANATLNVGSSMTASNPVTVASGSSGILSIINTQATNPTLDGAITLNNNLTVTNSSTVAGGRLAFGGITGTGNIISNANNVNNISFGAINSIGTITNSGTGIGTTTISGVIGTNVTGVIQNSATSQLTLSGANTFTSGLTIKAGMVDGLASNAFGANSNVITIGDTSVNLDATLQGRTYTYANPITVASVSSGTLTLKSLSATYSGAITLNHNLTILNAGWDPVYIQGGITGTGNLIINNNTTGPAGELILSTASINNTGTITNSGTSSIAMTISAVIGSNVTGVIQNSATSALTLSGINTYTGPITNSAGTLNLTQDGTYSTLTLAGDTTTKITSTKTITLTDLVCNGSAGHLCILNSSSAGSAHILTTSSPQIDTDYLSVQDSTPVQQSTWYAGANGSLVSNTGYWGLVPNTAPNAPTLVSPANDTDTTDTTPTLSANYSDPDTGDVGTTNYRISSSSLVDCTTNTNVIKFGTSSETADNNEDTTFTPTAITEGDATYYWCAQNDDSVLQSAWTQMGTFNLDTTPPTTMATAGSYTFGETSPDPVTVTLTCDDAGGSGCLSTVYCTDTANTCSPATPYVVPFEISAEGTTYVRFYSIDALSNTETPANSETIIIDSVATRYWVGGTGNWSDDDNHWATTSGGSPANGNIPSTGDIVYFDSSSGTGTVTIDTGSVSVLDLNETSSNITIATSTNGITVTGNVTVNGTISGATAITLNTASKTLTAGSGATISSPVVLGATRTIAVATGTLTMSGIISDGGNAYGISKTGAGQLTLSGANTFTGGLTIKAGTIYGSGSANAFGGSGTGTITLGDTSGSSNVILNTNTLNTYANPITVASGSSGTVSITNDWGPTWSGAITLNKDLTIIKNYSYAVVFTGGFTGSGNIIINEAGSTGSLTISTTSINNTGTITNSGSGSGTTTISAVIGTNVTGVIQNSATSQLTLSGANTFTSGLTIKAGTTLLSTSVNAAGSGSITIGDTSGSADATLKGSLSAGNIITNPISVVSGSSGTLSIIGTANGTFGGAISLSNNLTIGSISAGPVFSGGISGNGNVTISVIGTTAFTVSGASLNHTGTITNSGTGTGTTTISAVIGTNVTGVIQNSATSQLTLSGDSGSYTNGVVIKAGQVTLVTNNNAAGTGTITIGDTSGSADATLSTSSYNKTFTNPIIVASGNSGTLKISSSSLSTFSGVITLNNNLLLSSSSDNYGITFSGGVTGTGNITTNTINSGYITFSTTSINHTGTITNFGSGTGTTTISSVIGSNVTGVIQNSATSQLTLSGNNTWSTGGLTIKAGTVQVDTSGNALGTGTVTIGDTSGNADAILLALGNLTYGNAISVASGSSGASIINTHTGATNLSGAVTLSKDITIKTTGGNLTLSGAITGNGNIVIDNAYGSDRTITLSKATGDGINPTGTITNISSNTGGGTTTISGIIGSNVTGITQNSSTSALTLSGVNTYTGPITNSAGTLNLTQNTTYSTMTLAGDTTTKITSTKTITLTDLVCNGSAGHLCILNSSSAGSAHILTTSSPEIATDYLSVQDSTPVEQSTWYAGANGTLVSNTGYWGLAPNTAPNAPTLVSPANDSDTADTTPTLSANYSDPDTGDVGTTNYRISSSSLADCTSNTNVVAWGTSSETPDNNEDTTYTVTEGQALSSDATYYWCAQNDDGVLTSSWTQMATFNLDTTAPVTTADAGSYTFNTWTNSNVVVTLICTDAGGVGCSATLYCLDTDNTCVPNLTYTTPVTISTQDTSYIRYASTDTVNNTETTKTQTIKIDKIDPVLAEVTAVTTPSTDTTPDYTFSTDKAGTITYGGSCSSATTTAVVGDNTITFNALSAGTYSNCTITVTDSSGNASSALSITTFTITAVSTPAPSGDGGGGGGLPVDAYSLPEGPFSILINNKASSTYARDVVLNFTAGLNVVRMALSNSSDFAGASQETYSQTKLWTLSEEQGQKTVYVKFFTKYGVSSNVFSANIDYNIVSTEPSGVIAEVEKITEQVIEIGKQISILFPGAKIAKIPAFPPIAISVPQEPQMIFKGGIFISKVELEKIAILPLPESIKDLALKFPKFGQTLEKVGVTKPGDVPKLQTAKLVFPGLSEASGTTPSLSLNKFTKKEVEQVPTSFVFARVGKDNIDLNTKVAISNLGEPIKTINTIQNKPLYLVVKPDTPAKSVKGYVIFKSANSKSAFIDWTKKLSKVLSASLLDATNLPANSGQADNEVVAKKNIVLQKFSYQDLDKDGVWTAEIQTPVVDGKYEIRTEIDYFKVAPEEESRETISMIMVVDPEGYIYKKIGKEEVRIADAEVSIYWQNPKTNQFELWPANDFQQQNPQITDQTGKYSFLVPIGKYYLEVKSKDYSTYKGEVFEVTEGAGVHTNIELSIKNWFWKMFTIERVMLGIVIILLILIFTVIIFKKIKTKL
jgi:autotransporter-associated beta strand protein